MNEFHPHRNPEGAVNMGVAENKLTSSMLVKKFDEVAQKGLKVPMDLMNYHDSSGYTKLKVAVAGVLERHVFGAVGSGWGARFEV